MGKAQEQMPVMKSGYCVHPLQELIRVEGIATLHYFEFARDFVFEGEEHDFWELVYVDKGEVEVIAGHQGFRLRQGEMIFHQPGEFHNIWADGNIASNIIVLTFDGHGDGISAFQGRMAKAGPNCKNLISQILAIGTEIFEGPFDDPYLKGMTKRADSRAESEQTLRNCLELLLLNMIREKGQEVPSDRIQNTITERTYGAITEKIDRYLAQNLNRNITLEELSRALSISKSYLSDVFHKVTGETIIRHTIHLKMEEAKKLIREGTTPSPKSRICWDIILCFTFHVCSSREPISRLGSMLSQSRPGPVADCSIV